MRPASKRKLSALFNSAELAQIEAFLGRDGGFSLAGEMAIVRMFVDIQEYSASFDEIFKRCEAEWRGNWSLQDSHVRGNPAADGEVGIRNSVSLESFYLFFRTPSPLVAIALEIPTGSFVAKTKNDRYQFGEADLDGWRTVARDSGGLNFNRGKVHYLAIAKSIEIEYVDSSHHMWGTTPVLYVQ